MSNEHCHLLITLAYLQHMVVLVQPDLQALTLLQDLNTGTGDAVQRVSEESKVE